MTVNNKIILWLAIIVITVSEALWSFYNVSVYYIGFATFLFLLSAYIKLENRKSLVSVFLFELCAWNLIKEIFFDPKVITLSEVIFIVSLPIIYYFKNGSKFN